MEQSDLLQLKREVLDQGPEAALPCNLSDQWLAMLARDIEMLQEEAEGDHSYLSAPLAIIIQLLLGKSGQSEGSLPVDKLFEYLQYLHIEIALEVARRSADMDIAPATMETIFTNQVAWGH